MAQIVLFNKPFNVLTQFRPDGERITLAHYINDKSLRVAGRLDYDSEGLLLLTDDGQLNQHLTHPNTKQFKTYLVQVDGVPNQQAIEQLKSGVALKDGLTLPAHARVISEPDWLWSRDPPIRYRANLPTSWLEIKICEGKNRQVRRMTAAVGLPTLRLIRTQIGPFYLEDLALGELKALDGNHYAEKLNMNQRTGGSGSFGLSTKTPSTGLGGSAGVNRFGNPVVKDLDRRNKRRRTLPIASRGK